MHLDTSVPLLVPDLPSPHEVMPYLQRMHEAKWYANFGPLVCDLEQRLTERFQAMGGGSDALPVTLTTVSSATAGLELVLTALDLPPRSRVLVPALTFIATATAVVRAGHVPVPCDIDQGSWLLTPAIASKLREYMDFAAVLPVAAFGVTQDVQAWARFEAATGVPVVIDAAGAFGSQWLGGCKGTMVFSMHATKSLPAGEGGAVVSTNAALVVRVRQLSNFGINLHPQAGSSSMPFPGGTNAKMSEYHGAVALASLARWDEKVGRRHQRYLDYQARLNAAADNRLVWQDADLPAAPTLLCLRMPSAAARHRLELLCQQSRIMTRRWYQPLLGLQLALDPAVAGVDVTSSSAVAEGLIGLPFFADITDEQVARVSHAVARALELA